MTKSARQGNEKTMSEPVAESVTEPMNEPASKKNRSEYAKLMKAIVSHADFRKAFEDVTLAGIRSSAAIDTCWRLIVHSPWHAKALSKTVKELILAAGQFADDFNKNQEGAFEAAFEKLQDEAFSQLTTIAAILPRFRSHNRNLSRCNIQKRKPERKPKGKPKRSPSQPG